MNNYHLQSLNGLEVTTAINKHATMGETRRVFDVNGRALDAV